MPRDKQSPAHCHHLYSTGSGPFTVGQPSPSSQYMGTPATYKTNCGLLSDLPIAAPLSRASYAASSASLSSGSSDSIGSDFRDSEPDCDIFISPSSSPPSDFVETFEKQFIDGKYSLHTSRHLHSAKSVVVKVEDCCGRLCSVCGERSDQPRDKSRDVEICGECWDDVDVLATRAMLWCDYPGYNDIIDDVLAQLPWSYRRRNVYEPDHWMDDIHKHYCVADFVVIAEEVLTCNDPMMIEFMEERRQGVALRMEMLKASAL